MSLENKKKKHFIMTCQMPGRAFLKEDMTKAVKNAELIISKFKITGRFLELLNVNNLERFLNTNKIHLSYLETSLVLNSLDKKEIK